MCIDDFLSIYRARGLDGLNEALLCLGEKQLDQAFFDLDPRGFEVIRFEDSYLTGVRMAGAVVRGPNLVIKENSA